jgi:hypothetical protein
MIVDGPEALADDVEEPTKVNRVARCVTLPCTPCRRSGCVTVVLGERREPRLCLWCRGVGFRTVMVMTGTLGAEAGDAR